jgi:hypothetical protein
MAHFVWVGGYTGFTGAGSGFSAANNLWFSVVSGATSAEGDIFYAPYAWNLTHNWRERLTVTGGVFNYIPTNRLPRGSDTVAFGIVRSASGTTVAYGISCLYGGLSGDGITNGSLTGWNGSTGPASIGAIGISIKGFVRNIPNPASFETGRIGVASTATGYADFTNFKPLRVLASSLGINPDAQVPYSDENAPVIAIDNRITNTPSSLFISEYNPSPAGQLYAKGTWSNVNQFGMSLYITEGTVSNMLVGGTIRNSVIDAASTCEQYYQYPCRLDGNISIGCSIGSGGETDSITLNPYMPTSPNTGISVGQFNTGTIPTYPVMKIGENSGGISGGTGIGPFVSLGSSQINKIEFKTGTVTVDPRSTIYDYPIIRDGFMQRGCVLNMNHPDNPAWGGFLIGLSPSDQGLRVDSNEATVVFIPGQSFKTVYEGVSLTG